MINWLLTLVFPLIKTPSQQYFKIIIIYSRFKHKGKEGWRETEREKEKSFSFHLYMRIECPKKTYNPIEVRNVLTNTLNFSKCISEK